MNITISPPPDTIATQKIWLRGRVGSKACFDCREKREREALTRAGMCWTCCRRTFVWTPRLPLSWTAEDGLSAGPPIWSGDDMNEIRRNTPNRRNRSCWGRNRDTHPQRRSEKACRSGLWIKADGHGLLCAVFSCSLGSKLFLALWGSVRGFKWPYKTTVRLTLPPPHRKQAWGEVTFITSEVPREQVRGGGGGGPRAPGCWLHFQPSSRRWQKSSAMLEIWSYKLQRFSLQWEVKSCWAEAKAGQVNEQNCRHCLLPK